MLNMKVFEYRESNLTDQLNFESKSHYESNKIQIDSFDENIFYCKFIFWKKLENFVRVCEYYVHFLLNLFHQT